MGVLASAHGRPPELPEKDGGVAMSEVRLPRCQLRIVWPHDGRDCQFPDRRSTVALIRAMLTVAWTSR